VRRSADTAPVGTPDATRPSPSPEDIQKTAVPLGVPLSPTAVPVTETAPTDDTVSASVSGVHSGPAGHDPGELDYHALNAMLNLYDKDGKIQFDKDRQAARQYFLQHVNQNTVFFHNLDEKLDYLLKENYY